MKIKMGIKRIILSCFIILFLPVALMCERENKIIISSDKTNNLYTIIKNNKLPHSRYDSPEEALNNVRKGDVLLILADNYPEKQTEISDHFYRTLKKKNCRTYIEYPSHIPDFEPGEVIKADKERVVINTNLFMHALDSLSILGLNGLHYISGKTKIESPLIVTARVAGFNRAIYGLPEKSDPLLFQLSDSPVLVSTTSLSNFISGRYAPQQAWGLLWKEILEYLLPEKEINALLWDPEVRTTYEKDEQLPPDYQRRSIEKGIEWYANAKMLIADSFADSLQNLINRGTERIKWSEDIPLGDGSRGSLECVFSEIDENGSQPLGIIVRGDCVSETAMAYALSGAVLNNHESKRIAENLLDFYLFDSSAMDAEYGDPHHPAYGLIPWGISNHNWYKASYGDDNARFFLASIITSAVLQNEKWDDMLLRSLLALLRTTGEHGFRGSRIDLNQIEEYGWEYYQKRDIVNLSPHFEAYLWACFIWAYHQTGDELFLDKAEKGINIMMENYPHRLIWTNGLAQEKARMLLPLSWLLQVRNTTKNRAMLQRVVNDILLLQDESGAIREELGSIEMGRYPPPQTNEAYGKHEASLIAQNGDPVSDLLYTTNFAFLGLHEASYALNDPSVQKAADSLAEFLCRIQVKSSNHPELDGGWMRAFDFERFEHWGSNADAGWGAWAIESGWTQGWITSILSLRELKKSIWDITNQSKIETNYHLLKKEMLE